MRRKLGSPKGDVGEEGGGQEIEGFSPGPLRRNEETYRKENLSIAQTTDNHSPRSPFSLCARPQ